MAVVKIIPARYVVTNVKRPGGEREVSQSAAAVALLLVLPPLPPLPPPLIFLLPLRAVATMATSVPVIYQWQSEQQVTEKSSGNVTNAFSKMNSVRPEAEVTDVAFLTNPVSNIVTGTTRESAMISTGVVPSWPETKDSWSNL